jgi:hypothetical protein
MRPFTPHALFLLALVTLNGCAPRPEDDAFARRALEQLRTRDSAFMQTLDPESSIHSASWAELQSVAGRFGTPPTRPVLVGWERGSRADVGAYRSLRYWVGSSPDSTVVEVYVVERNGRAYVNTLRAQSF